MIDLGDFGGIITLIMAIFNPIIALILSLFGIV